MFLAFYRFAQCIECATHCKNSQNARHSIDWRAFYRSRILSAPTEVVQSMECATRYFYIIKYAAIGGKVYRELALYKLDNWR